MTAIVRDTEGCGAEIANISLPDASAAEIDLIRQTVFRRGVAFLHGQHLSPEQHIAFAEQIGPIVVNRYFPPSEKYPQIAKVEKTEAQTTNIGGGWHTDHSYDVEPAMGSVLLAIDTPPSGGDTMFANMYQAYDALSKPMQELLDGLTAEHTLAAAVLRTSYAKEFGGKVDEAAKKNAIHPVVRVHPYSKRKALFVNPGFTSKIQELNANESEALLNMLFTHTIKPEFIYRHSWQKNDVLMWDNFCNMHYAVANYKAHGFRHLHRTTVVPD